MHSVAPVAKYLFGFCAAVTSCGTAFAVKDTYGNPIFAEPRFLGYAAAYHCGAIEVIVLFGPVNETDFITKFLLAREVPAEAIVAVETNVSTAGNAKVMMQWIREHNVSSLEYVLSSSGYHDRAPYFAWQNGLTIRTIPAEAFLFAQAANKDEKAKVFRYLQRTFYGYCRASRVAGFICQLCGVRTYVERAIDDWQGIGDHLAGRYELPHLPY